MFNNSHILCFQINMTTIVPPLAVFLAKHPLVLKYDLSSLLEVWCGAAPLSKEIQTAVSKRCSIIKFKKASNIWNCEEDEKLEKDRPSFQHSFLAFPPYYSSGDYAVLFYSYLLIRGNTLCKCTFVLNR